MYLCEICKKQADVHHIVHRSEGGLDIKLNYKYLCSYHHRGKFGPHHCEKTDILYKLELQDKLFHLLQNDYYKFKDLMGILEVSQNQLKRIVKDLKLYKEGYNKIDIIVKIMGGKLYSEEMIINLNLDKLIDNIDKEY